LGLGESGVGAALLARKKGFDVYASDSKRVAEKYAETLRSNQISFQENGHDEARILKSDIVVKSPGIPNTAPVVRKASEAGISIISEIEFASRYTEGKLIAITGTNGKTTTTKLTYHILKSAGLDVAMAGNVGRSFAAELAESDHEYWVLEVSSFQLDNIETFRPHISVLLNITPDHLDRYDSYEDYILSKFNIARNQESEDYFLYGSDFPVIREKIATSNIRATSYPISVEQPLKMGGWVENEEIKIKTIKGELNMSIYDLALQGKHNSYNSLASGMAAKLVGIRKSAIRESLSDFEQVEHRLETVQTINGVDFINDSKATNINSTWYALDSMSKGIVWICGGVDKGNDYEQLRELVRNKVKAIVCLGLDNSKIIDAFKEEVEILTETKDMETAVRTAYSLAAKNEAVLLSPACASFDLFENYEDRGNQFKAVVKEI
jgi:UDP-N-acetylmuramoylalanine--D-glutamate ligase